MPASNAIYKEREYWDARFETEEAYDWLVEADEGGESPLLDALRARARAPTTECSCSAAATRASRPRCTRAAARASSAPTSRASSCARCARATQAHDVARRGHARPQGERARRRRRRRRRRAAAARIALGAPHGTGSFDVVLDKAAMDALLVDEGSVWDPCDGARAAARGRARR